MKRLMIVLAACVMLGAGPATMPTSQPVANASYPALQKKLAELREEIDQLRKENGALRAALAAADARDSAAEKARTTTPDNADALRAAVVDRLKIGMSVKEVVAILGEPRQKSRQDDLVVYEYKATNPGVQVGATYYPGQTYAVSCSFRGDYLASVRDADGKDAPIHTGGARAQDGRSPR